MLPYYVAMNTMDIQNLIYGTHSMVLRSRDCVYTLYKAFWLLLWQPLGILSQFSDLGLLVDM